MLRFKSIPAKQIFAKALGIMLLSGAVFCVGQSQHGDQNQRQYGQRTYSQNQSRQTPQSRPQAEHQNSPSRPSYSRDSSPRGSVPRESAPRQYPGSTRQQQQERQRPENGYSRSGNYGAPNNSYGRVARPPSYSDPTYSDRSSPGRPSSQRPESQSPPQYGQRQGDSYSPQQSQVPRPPGTPTQGHHSGQWLSQHRDLPADQQKRLLESDPQFRSLPQSRQQQLQERLRGQLNNNMQQLPPERRQAVENAIRALRGMPPDARQRAIDSGRFDQFSEQERGLLNGVSHLPLAPPTSDEGNTVPRPPR
jgi:hypothetical protein